MNFRKRQLPRHESLEKISKCFGGQYSLSNVEMILLLLNSANCFRTEVFTELENRYGLSEGKMILLMALVDNAEGLPVGELATRIGVSCATVSVMIKRMLAVPSPLIAVINNQIDARSRVVKLSETGAELIAQALPFHLSQIENFSQKLNPDERKKLIELLSKLT